MKKKKKGELNRRRSRNKLFRFIRRRKNATWNEKQTEKKVCKLCHSIWGRKKERWRHWVRESVCAYLCIRRRDGKKKDDKIKWQNKVPNNRFCIVAAQAGWRARAQWKCYKSKFRFLFMQSLFSLVLFSFFRLITMPLQNKIPTKGKRNTQSITDFRLWRNRIIYPFSFLWVFECAWSATQTNQVVVSRLISTFSVHFSLLPDASGELNSKKWIPLVEIDSERRCGTRCRC